MIARSRESAASPSVAAEGGELSSQLVLFRVGERVFASDVHDVVRIAGNERDGDEVVHESCLGRPLVWTRGLVVRDGADGHRVLAVDSVLGVKEPAPDDVHPLPALAAACLPSCAVRGLALLGEETTLLIDLPTLIREQDRQTATPPLEEDSHA